MTPKGFAVVVFLSLGSALTAETINVGSLGSSLFADGEIATNIVINSRRSDTKELTVRVASLATETSALQIAFGKDLDGDGDLDPEETVMAVGRRGQKYFIEDVAAGERYTETIVSASSDAGFLELEVLTDVDYRPQSVSICSEQGRLFASLGVQSWMYDPEWNLVKLTRRGTGAIREVCKVANEYRAMMMLFR